MVPDENGDRPSSEWTTAQAISNLNARVSSLEAQLATLRGGAPNPSPPPLLPPSAVAEDSTAPGKLPAPPRVSLENRLGSQVFNRIGIIALLTGVALFLKIAIDNRWLGPVGRILVGLLAGAAVVLWSERFRRSGFAAFSYSLKAIGTGVLYLSLWAAFQLYGLLPAAAALGAMILVTAWNAWMAWSQDAELLAAYALAGALATPLLLSTGGNHQVFLFSYLLGIDFATVLLVRLKPWPRLLVAAFPATVGYYVGWYAGFHQSSPVPVTLAFLAGFFLLFAAPIVLLPDAQAQGAVVHQRGRTLSEVLLPLGNAVFTGLAVYALLDDAGHHDLTPWVMLLFAAIYLGLIRLPQPAVTRAVHLSLGVAFITVAIALRASGRWITVGWLVEGVTLLWVSTRLTDAHTRGPGYREASAAATVASLRNLAVAALALGFVGFLWNLFELPLNTHSAFLNARFATALVAIAAFVLSTGLSLRSPDRTDRTDRPTSRQIAGASVIAFNLVALLAVVREVGELWPHSLANKEAELQTALCTSAFLMLYGAGLLAVGFWKRSAFVRWQALALLIFSIAKTFLYDTRNLSQGYRVVSFLGLGALLMGVSFAYQKDWLVLREPSPSRSEVEP